jgi:hypothetical protein
VTPDRKRASPITVLIILAALVVGFFGLTFLTQATFGVGLLALSCLLGIMGRIAQAGDYQ